jgi:hypothetical protein
MASCEMGTLYDAHCNSKFLSCEHSLAMSQSFSFLNQILLKILPLSDIMGEKKNKKKNPFLAHPFCRLKKIKHTFKVNIYLKLHI